MLTRYGSRRRFPPTQHVKTTRKRGGWTAFAAGLLFSTTALAQISGSALRIGVLDDQSGPLSALSGAGSVVAARMAVEDFGGTILGKPIEIVAADHQNKADIGANIARTWYDETGVSMITGLGNSSVSIAVQQLTRDKKRVSMVTSGGTFELTGKYCSPNGVHWTLDTYSVTKGTVESLVRQGAKTWFFLTADYAAGYSFEEVGRKTLVDTGGQAVGAVKHPLSTMDFSSFILQAQSSKAQVLGLANAGGDTINAIKQAVEFGLPAQGMRLAALYFDITDVHALGAQIGGGLTFTASFYWDMNEKTRAWSKRFMERHSTAPAQAHAGTYGAVTHYLKAVQAAGTDNADAVMAKMRELPIDDVYTKGGSVREDGRVIRDMYLFEVKQPKEASGSWDLLKLVDTIPGDKAFRPMSEGGCSYLKR
ncbi:ABC transporter substrate-binding protein [Enterovirga sp.]|jgi:branched-chain amino acid transport system substrate-binding protein|uniref:ABC transporter substrate-binding protein n=1 Tax=Enterovirga sp. TaxID=2026350 RepID=UPI00261A9291|nr:ABC transporter substrate-binding protein [Enterovirga sp.]MDB5590545.1 transporter permease [Enterovirga sp.]